MVNNDISKTLILIGIAFVVIGLIYNFFPKGGSLPKLPGDILIKKDNFTFYFPLATSLIISATLSLLYYLFFRK